MPADQLSPGSSRTAVVVDNLTRTQLVMYAGASGDYNPLHTDEVYATVAAGHRSVFAHGMFTMAAAARVLTDWVPPQSILSYSARFMAQVWPGDTLTATATVAAREPSLDGSSVEFDLVVTNQDGTTVLRGSVTARV